MKCAHCRRHLHDGQRILSSVVAGPKTVIRQVLCPGPVTKACFSGFSLFLCGSEEYAQSQLLLLGTEQLLDAVSRLLTSKKFVISYPATKSA